MNSFLYVLIFIALWGCGKTAEPRSSAIPPAPSGGIDKPVANIGTASKNQAFRAQISSWQMGPQVTKSDDTRNEFQVKVMNANGADPEKIEVLDLFPYMKIHGHGVPKSYAPKWELEGNIIKVTRLGFIMSGPWEVNIKARVNGTEDAIEISVVVP